MLIFKAIIDGYTCDVCKERNGKDAFYKWGENLFIGPDEKLSPDENLCKNVGCRCVLVEPEL